ncbi:uncharacterized protein LOC116134153 [Pistacia vera]|uniref:uncharacterized protein LOC116134153 n=1 Tax=Pistacia vera TaxID=55513 RepID=UPI00126312B7|nr:uncharacterized protein LOC116134153 [Pistacia vera]
MLGKKAAKALPGGTDLSGKGNFSSVSYRPPIQRTESVYTRGYEAFDSRMRVLQEIMEALKDSNVNMVGVYGMAGVGKTTLVKKVAWQAEEDKLFDQVVMTTVTQTPDLKNMQEEIADQLGLIFPEQSVSGRSLRLRDRLKREKRILVILDDIWAKVDLDVVGIPYGDIHEGIGQEKEDWRDRKDDDKRYKILLTSRDQDLLRNHMNVQKNFFVDLLSDREAWNLFQKIVGDFAETAGFRPIAEDLVGKCSGLPIAIETVAKALKNKSLPVWKDALGQLRRSNPRPIEGMATSVYSIIELSYNFLRSEEKSLLLLCGLVNTGSHIHISYLLRYSMGLRLLQDVYTLEDGRNRLHSLIHGLKASSLLLDGITNDTVKMHDIIHAVVVSIASSDKFMFNIKNVVDLKAVLEEKPKTSNAISLHYGDIGDELPQSLEYPKLKFFHLFRENHFLEIPDLLFQGMKELQVLDLTGICALSLPSSLRCLKNLQTLCLNACLLEDIAIVGELEKLEILSLLNSDIEKLPGEIGQLTRLKMLDLTSCSKLKVIAPNVISSLSRLEELYMSNSFLHWEIEGLINNQERSNASLLELKQLSRLTTLDIYVHGIQIIQEDLFSEKLIRYRILIGDQWNWRWHTTYGETSRMLKIKLDNSISLIHRVKILLKKTEELHLELNGVKNAIDELDEGGFAQLKHLQVQNGHELLYVVSVVPSKTVFPRLESLFLHNLIKLEKICDGELYAESFSKLRILKVEKCDRLEHLFSFSEYKKFSQLQEIEVIDCKNLKEIFGEESVDLVVENARNSKLEFTPLRSLVLQCLPQFISFGMKVVLPRLENLTLYSIKIEDIWLGQPQLMSSFQYLKILTVEECNGLKFLFSSSMVKSFMQLQKLVICKCKSMEAVILDSEGLEVQDKIIDMSFPPKFVPNLRVFQNSQICTGNSAEFPTLNELHIESFSNLKTFFSDFSGVDLLREEPERVSLEDYIIDVNPLLTKRVVFVNLSIRSSVNFTLKENYGMVGFRKFEHLNLCEFLTLKENIWNGKVPIDLFCNLKSLVLDGLLIATIIPSNVLSYFKNVETIEVAFPSLEKMILLHLDNLQLIWHDQLHGDSFSKLKEVRVEFCEKLMNIVPSNSTQGLLPFHNLERLTVKECWNMKSLFPVYIAAGLLQLKELEITACGLKEIVVAKEEIDGTPRFCFPQLTFLKLAKLPELKHFYVGLHKIEWPRLERLLVYKCEKIKVYASDGESQPALFSFEKVIPNLEWLGLNADNITSRCLDHIPARSFRKLKFFVLVNCDNESIAFWFGVLQKLYHLEKLYLADSTLQELDYQVGTFLQNLQTLKVERCHLLKYLMPSSVISFKNLKSLEVFSCNGLAKILACSTGRALVYLTSIRIRECKLVKEVIANDVDNIDKEIAFNQLKILELHCLPSLTSFCSANFDFEFPCLEQVIVSQCPNLKIFSQGGLSTPKLNRVQLTKKIDEEYLWNDDLNSTIHHMFANMAGFRKFEHLNLCEFLTLKENIWNGKLPIDLFCNLKSLVLDRLSDIATIIPSNVLSYFKNVESIEVKSCDSLKKVFDMGEQLDYVAAKRSHPEILDFKNLKSLKVDSCNNLRYIFTASLVSSLVQLEQIEIKSCALVEEIITKEGEKEAIIDKIKIPWLKSINLESLPNLTSFYSGSNILECPPLENIIIKDCQNVHLKDFSLHLPSLFSENVVFPTMDDLTSSSIITEWIWQSQLPATSSCFEKLTILVIDGFDHLKYFFSSSMVKSLFELKELEISNCKLIEEIIVEDEERTSTMLFPKLYQLKLRDLPKLTTFCSSTGNFVELSSLFRLWIDNCPGMKSFVSIYKWNDKTSTKKLEETNSNENLHAHMQSLFDKKVRLPCLERLVISHADEVEKIWDDQVSLDSFCKLNRVFVYFCNKILNIFPSNMLGRHQELEMLEVQNCDSVEEIFEVLEKRSGMVEEIVANEEAGHRFVFSNLTRLYLQRLPSLKSLYPNIHISEWPVLEELKVYGCNNVETLASEFLSIRETHRQSQNETPNKKSLFLVYKDAFPRLEELELCEMPRLLHLWGGNPQPNNAFQNLKTLKLSECGSLDNSWSSSVSFQNLVTLQVSKCDGLRYLLSLSKAKTLKWLASMNISECKMMDQIISNLEGEVVGDSTAFNNLNNLEIHCLPSLTSFCGEDISLEFQSLKKVIVKQCLKMETFCLGVLSTPKLQTLQLIEGEEEVEECGEGNPELNSAIQQLFNKRSSEED